MKRAGPQGWVDKLYWREVAPGRWCCFRKERFGPHAGLYISLCGREARLRTGGQALRRPAVIMRCGLCDGREAARRGWEESGPESPAR